MQYRAWLRSSFVVIRVSHHLVYRSRMMATSKLTGYSALARTKHLWNTGTSYSKHKSHYRVLGAWFAAGVPDLDNHAGISFLAVRIAGRNSHELTASPLAGVRVP
jgi:hypothetical protein